MVGGGGGWDVKAGIHKERVYLLSLREWQESRRVLAEDETYVEESSLVTSLSKR